MSVSTRCEQCDTVKRCRMFVEPRDCHWPKCVAKAEPHKHEVPVYICAPCARELGHA